MFVHELCATINMLYRSWLCRYIAVYSRPNMDIELIRMPPIPSCSIYFGTNDDRQ